LKVKQKIIATGYRTVAAPKGAAWNLELLDKDFVAVSP
jgi:hypothetical protein